MSFVSRLNAGLIVCVVLVTVITAYYTGSEGVLYANDPDSAYAEDYGYEYADEDPCTDAVKSWYGCDDQDWVTCKCSFLELDLPMFTTIEYGFENCHDVCPADSKLIIEIDRHPVSGDEATICDSVREMDHSPFRLSCSTSQNRDVCSEDDHMCMNVGDVTTTDSPFYQDNRWCCFIEQRQECECQSDIVEKDDNGNGNGNENNNENGN